MVARILELALIAVSLWFVWRVVRLLFKFQKEPEPPGAMKVPARLRGGPKNRSGAVALEEPDDDTV